MVVFKMRDSVPSASYSSVCNVLRQWNISLIPTYRVYRLYDTSLFLSNYVSQSCVEENKAVMWISLFGIPTAQVKVGRIN